MRTYALGAALLVSLAVAPSPSPATKCVNPPRPASLLSGFVTRVVDGDTVNVHLKSGLSDRVRLLGIDSPEVHESSKLNRDSLQSGKSKAAIQALGRLAWDFTRSRLNGRDVWLELDVQARDIYSRLLAYVWLADRTVFNMVILREGYAQILTIPPNLKYVDLFLACQREAREQGRGLWSK